MSCIKNSNWPYKWNRRHSKYIPPNPKTFKDIAGETFGKYTALYPVGLTTTHKIPKVIWKFRCLCGEEFEVLGTTMRSGISNPCKCIGVSWPYKWDRSLTDFIPRNKGRFQDLTGTRSGGLVACYPEKTDNNGNVLWRCTCDCRRTVLVRGTKIVNGKKRSCGCTLRGTGHNEWKGCGEIPGKFYSRLKRVARNRGYSVKVSPKFLWDLFLKQDKCCALSGLPIQLLDDEGKVNVTASVDRIDGSRGYSKDNTQWVHKDINRMKNTLDEKRFIELCCRIANRNSEESR